PFSMSLESGTPSSGAIYRFQKVLGVVGDDYQYRFEATDSKGATATGPATSLLSGPSVVGQNQPPTISFTGEAGYQARGVTPYTGGPSTPFVFRVVYRDPDNNAPAPGYPRVHVLKAGVEVSGSPFGMAYVSGQYSSGAIYSVTHTLQVGRDYSYF